LLVIGQPRDWGCASIHPFLPRGTSVLQYIRFCSVALQPQQWNLVAIGQSNVLTVYSFSLELMDNRERCMYVILSLIYFAILIEFEDAGQGGRLT